MQPGQKQLKLTNNKPTLAQDLLTINGKSSGEIDLLFSQVVSEGEKTIDASVVAAVRFPNLQALEATHKLIEEAIESIKNQEK